MSDTRSDVLAKSRMKAVAAGLTTAGAVTLGIAGAPVAAAFMAVPAALFTYRWWQHRASNGIRF